MLNAKLGKFILNDVVIDEYPKKLYLRFEYPKTSLEDISTICDIREEWSEIEKFILEVDINFYKNKSKIMAYLMPEDVDGDWGREYKIKDSEENNAAVKEFAFIGMSKLLTKILNAFYLE